MSKVYVVTNQHGHFINKHREWVDGRDPKLLFRSKHKDEAINLVFELSSKDISLRAEAIATELDDRDQPSVEVTSFIPTAKELEAENAANETDESGDNEPGGEQAELDVTTETEESGLPDTDDEAAEPSREALAAH